MTENVGNSSSSCLKKKCNESSQDKEVQQEMVNKHHVDVLGLTVEKVRGQKLSYLCLLYQQLHMPPFVEMQSFLKLYCSLLTSLNIFPQETWISSWLILVTNQRSLPGTCSCKSSSFCPRTFKGTPNAACLFKSSLAFETLSPAVNFGLLNMATLPGSSSNRPTWVFAHPQVNPRVSLTHTQTHAPNICFLKTPGRVSSPPQFFSHFIEILHVLLLEGCHAGCPHWWRSWPDPRCWTLQIFLPRSRLPSSAVDAKRERKEFLLVSDWRHEIF